MNLLEIRNLTFSYPVEAGNSAHEGTGQHETVRENALHDITLSVRQGEYIILCGLSGCGKTTLLRHLKPSLTPHGKRTGEILLCPASSSGNPDHGDTRDDTDTQNGGYGSQPIDLNTLDLQTEASLIGYCMQSPDDQIVTDRVWHELAFGLESLGTSQEAMLGRIANTASFFGIGHLVNRRTSDLSGGQKQLVNLASVLALRPKILLLDEPTSQLDPEAASAFLHAVRRIHTELNTTVIIAEQRIRELIPDADRVITLDHGEIIDDCPASQFNYPAYVRRVLPGGDRHDHDQEKMSSDSVRHAISVSGVSFRYERNGPDILKDLTWTVPKGSILSITGRNGSGKTTVLKVLCGLCRPQSGAVTVSGRASMLPQSARDLFVGKTVREDLRSASLIRAKDGRTGDAPDRIAAPDQHAVAAQCRITHLLDRHPYDLSGGETQRAALALLLMTGADILLLDEPSKGMDISFKQEFAEILRELRDQGRTIILVSHDHEFCEKCADMTFLLSDGQLLQDEAGPADPSLSIVKGNFSDRDPDITDSRPQPGERTAHPRRSVFIPIMTAVMTALAVLVRAAFIMTPHIRPMAAIVMIAGICLGPLSGMVSGALAAYLSNFIIGGQGPWTPWQMAAFALAGLVMGLLTKKGVLHPGKRLPTAVTGGLLILIVIGPLLDTSSVMMDLSGDLSHAAAVYRAGLPVNLLHAAATFVTLLIFCKPCYEQIMRYRRKHGVI